MPTVFQGKPSWIQCFVMDFGDVGLDTRFELRLQVSCEL